MTKRLITGLIAFVFLFGSGISAALVRADEPGQRRPERHPDEDQREPPDHHFQHKNPLVFLLRPVENRRDLWYSTRR